MSVGAPLSIPQHEQSRRRNNRLKGAFVLVPGLALLATATLFSGPAHAATVVPVTLGTDTTYAVLGGSTVTNTGTTVATATWGSARAPQ